MNFKQIKILTRVRYTSSLFIFHFIKLKANSELKSVYLSPDRTKEQRSAHGKLVNQMKEMIARDCSKHYFIRDNKINCVDKR